MKPEKSLQKSYIKLVIILLLTAILLITAFMGLRIFCITIIIIYPISWITEYALGRYYMKYETPDIVQNTKFCIRHKWVASFYEDTDWVHAPIEYFTCIKCWKKISPKEWKDKGYKDHNEVVKNIELKHGKYYIAK